MSARLFVNEATRTAHMPSRSLSRYGCCCHPRAWGKKKGLRRARRRVGQELIRQELASV